MIIILYSNEYICIITEGVCITDLTFSVMITTGDPIRWNRP